MNGERLETECHSSQWGHKQLRSRIHEKGSRLSHQHCWLKQDARDLSLPENLESCCQSDSSNSLEQMAVSAWRNLTGLCKEGFIPFLLTGVIRWDAWAGIGTGSGCSIHTATSSQWAQTTPRVGRYRLKKHLGKPQPFFWSTPAIWAARVGRLGGHTPEKQPSTVRMAISELSLSEDRVSGHSTPTPS